MITFGFSILVIIVSIIRFAVMSKINFPSETLMVHCPRKCVLICPVIALCIDDYSITLTLGELGECTTE